MDALDEIIIPRLTAGIRTITEVLNDEEREEFIRMKNIKEFLDIEND
ncbi:MAG: V-type ATP synthase subunit D [Promethearchaeota archaeon]